MASKPRVRLSLFLALCLVLCGRSFSFYFKRGFISPWSSQFVHRFLCLYWIVIVIFSGIIRFTFVNDDLTLGCSFASCKYFLRCMWSNWWTDKLLRRTRWNRTVSAHSLVNHVDSSMTEHKWRLFRKKSGYIECQKGQTQARKVITRPERQEPGEKETNGPLLVMGLYFSLTHAWVSRVASHGTALNIGIIIFIKCNHK